MAINAIRVPSSGGFIATENASAADGTFPESSPAIIQATEGYGGALTAFPLFGTGGYLAASSGAGTASDPWVPDIAISNLPVPPTPATYTEAVPVVAGAVAFTNPLANVFIAQDITGVSGNVTVALPTPAGPAWAILVLDGKATTGPVTASITGLAGEAPNLTVDGNIAWCPLYFDGTNWYAPVSESN